jgi:transposase
MNKKYLIQLTTDERATLEELTRTGTATAATQRHARILLKADTAEGGPAWQDARIAEAVEVSIPSVERVRRQFVTEGLQAALQRKKPSGPPRRKLDGEQEAHLIAVTCSDPPEGQERWTLALIADKLVELGVVDAIARETVRTTLKKTNLNRG